MPRFNTTDRRHATGTGPVAVDPGQPVVNHQGGTGYQRDAKSDAFLLATTSIDLTADAFYETGDARVARYRELIAQVAVADPDWTFRFLSWLRGPGNIRTAAIVGAVDAARALSAAGVPGGRHIVSAVLQRPDEPGEALAYHLTVHGRKLSNPVKRGVADAVQRLYNERALLKYDTASHGLRFADVLALTHARPAADRAHWQADLFQYAIDRRYGRDAADGARNLDIIRYNKILREQWATAQVTPGADLSRLVSVETSLEAAGMTWEDVLSALGSKVDKAVLWRALVPSMPFMARLRNLRNFDQAGLSDADVRPVLDMLTDGEAVRKSRQLPLRFLSAYRAAPSLRWGHALDQALNVSVGNIPFLTGSTLILVDTSGSMHAPMSGKTELMRWDAATSFGLALARRCQTADVVSFSNGYHGGTPSKVFPLAAGESLLRAIDRWNRDGFMINGGTDTAGALRRHYAGHDRVVILTDEQGGYSAHSTVRGGVSDQMPADRLLVTFNLAGYQTSHAPTGPYRVTVGGLTDAMFGLIPRIEQGRDGVWPWEEPGSTIGHLPQYPAPVAAGITR